MRHNILYEEVFNTNVKYNNEKSRFYSNNEYYKLLIIYYRYVYLPINIICHIDIKNIFYKINFKQQLN